MPNYNNVQIIGHLVREPELKYTNSEKGYTKFTVAVSRSYGDETDFIDCTAWNRGNYKLAEYTAKYEKGDAVFVAGEIRQNRWTTNDGQKRSKLEISVDNAFNFNQNKKNKNQNTNEEPPPAGSVNDDFNEDDFDVPF